eukprot:TRINITY_DN70588_c0_g1_i1.p1 TRINITY_DN70588_c0_g1~~TRINITY_DN70588_c0_g1_i1.p1  ORF type:complete len:749 (+),score=254.43 TRINITY_DN70588_c0_g1_i1:108-2249(+)
MAAEAAPRRCSAPVHEDPGDWSSPKSSSSIGVTSHATTGGHARLGSLDRCDSEALYTPRQGPLRRSHPGHHRRTSSGPSAGRPPAPPFALHLQRAVRRRLERETFPFVAPLRELAHAREQHAAAQAELGALRRRNAELEQLAQLAAHDSGGGGGASAGSAARVADLERQLERMREEMSAYQRTQQRVLARYEDELSAARKAEQEAAGQARRAKEEAERLRKLAAERGDALTAQRDALSAVQGRLSAAEAESSRLSAEREHRQDEMSHVKLKDVRRHCEALAAKQGADGAAGLRDACFAEFPGLRDVVEDALGCAGDEIRPGVIDALTTLGQRLERTLDTWLGDAKTEWLLLQTTLLDREHWQPQRDQVRSREIPALYAEMRSKACTLARVFLPSDVSWRHWRGLCQAVGGVTQQLAVSIAAPATTPDAHRGYPEFVFRLNSLVAAWEDYLGIVSTIERDWTAIQLCCGGLLRGGSGDRFADIAGMSAATADVLAAQATVLCHAAARVLLPPHALTQQFADLYTIDLRHYKKYKHREEYTRDNSHLKPATGQTMGTLLLALETSTRVPPLTKQRPSHRADMNFAAVLYGAVLKGLAGELLTVLLDGGDARWFHPEQSHALMRDVRQVETLFERLGVPRREVCDSLARVTSVISGVMAQPTEALVRGGQVCVPYEELPEDSPGSIWCKSVVRRVIAHRKDKLAKKFTEKHPAPKK